MNFNTLEFLLFLPAVLALHWALPHRLRWALLLASSWLFYFWWEPMVVHRALRRHQQRLH